MPNPLPVRLVVSRIPEPARFYFPVLGLASNLGTATAAAAPVPAVWYVELTAFGWLLTVLPNPTRH
jgi:hypothetical protein